MSPTAPRSFTVAVDDRLAQLADTYAQLDTAFDLLVDAAHVDAGDERETTGRRRGGRWRMSHDEAVAAARGRTRIAIGRIDTAMTENRRIAAVLLAARDTDGRWDLLPADARRGPRRRSLGKTPQRGAAARKTPRRGG